MATTFYIREDTTDPVNITLKSGASAADITGYTSVAIFLRSEDGTAQVDHSTADGNITVVSASAGTITVKFDEGDLLFSKRKYTGYIIVVDGSSNRSSFPEDDGFVFIVGERYTGDA